MVLGYWAQLIEAAEPAAAVPYLGVPSAVDAAGAHAQSLIETSEGAWTQGVIRVWDAKRGEAQAAIFDVSARFVLSTDEDAEEGDMDCELEILERP